MKLYEGMFLFDSNVASRDWPGLEKHVTDILGKHSAELVFTERWPDGKLAYEIKGARKGTYYLTYFNADGGAIPGIERDCQLSERVLRLLVVQHEGLEDELAARRSAAESKEAEAERKEEEAASPPAAPAAPAEAASAEPAVAEKAVAEPAVAEKVVAEGDTGESADKVGTAPGESREP